MQRLPIDENIPNIKTLAEQMVRINFAPRLEELEKNNNSLPENINNKLTFQKKNTFNIKNPSQKINKKFIRNDSNLSNLSSNKSKKKSNQSNTKSELSELGKNQDGNSNIINTNANLNTNINTTTNLNSRLNTNTYNNNFNINSNINSNNKKEDELYSDKNSQIYPINENSSNVSNSNNRDDELENKDNKEKSENDNDNENTIVNINESKVIKKDSNVTVEIINPVLLKKLHDDSFDDINTNNNKNNKNNKIKLNNKVKKSRIRKSTLYEREMRNLNRKNKKLEKKREQLYYDKIKHLKPGPEIDPYSEEIIEGKEIYIPIDKRAAKLHSLKITKRILNEENNKIKQKEKEDEELKKDISRNKIFDQDEWDNFLERQYVWKDELEYKKKAAQIYKNNENKNKFFKPKINNKSKSIIKDIQYGNDVIDEVFVRLYNDFEEHKERQKLRNDQSLPTFKPKIYKNSSQKNLNIKYNLKVPNKSGTTPLINIRNNDKMKKKYSIASSTSKIVNKKQEKTKAKSEKIFCDLYNNNIEKYLNKIDNNKSSKNQNMAIKTQGVTQPTNNTHTNSNYTDINTDLINSKYIILEKPFNKGNKIKKNLSQPQLKPKIPFLPLNIKKMIEQNCNEENEDEDENNDNKRLDNNYKFGITEHSNYEDGQSNFDEKSKYYNGNNNENEESEDNNNLKMDLNDNEGTKKIFSILNSNNNSMKLIEKYNDYEKGKKYYGQSQNETINSDDSKYTDNNLYKLNIRDSTPHLIKQDIIMGNKDYSDFFDVPDMSEDN